MSQTATTSIQWALGPWQLSPPSFIVQKRLAAPKSPVALLADPYPPRLALPNPRPELARLHDHLFGILMHAACGRWREDEVFRVGGQRHHWTFAPDATGLTVTAPDGAVYRYRVSLTMNGIRRLVNLVRQRVFAFERARFLADLDAELAGLRNHRLEVAMIPRDGFLTIRPAGGDVHSRALLSIHIRENGMLTFAPFTSMDTTGAAQQPIWTKRYRWHPNRVALFDLITQRLEEKA